MKRLIFCIATLLYLSGLFGQVNNISPSNFNITLSGNTYSIPYQSSHTLGQVDPGLKYAVISLHGANRNSEDYYSNMVAAANQVTDASDSTLIIAPQFLTETDIESFSLPNNYIYWTSGGWVAGSLSRNESSNPRPDRIASYQVLDSLIHRISGMGIEVITLVGHSAGGQVVQRYAATSPTVNDEGLTARLRFIVMNPSSYVYMDDQRRTGTSLTDFSTPSTGCTAYDEWKFGLNDMFTYPGRSSKAEIRERFQNADVTYVIGGSDNDPNDSSLDKDCEAQLQGSHRLERATVFYNYIQKFYREQTHRLDTVPNVGHNHAQMFGSAEGVFHIFQARNGISTSNRNLAFLGGIVIYPNPVYDIIRFELPNLTDSLSASITDMMGRTIGTYNIEFRTTAEIDVAQLEQGLYVLQVVSTQGIYSQKFVKR